MIRGPYRVPTLKRCSRCHREFPRTEFERGRHKVRPDRLRPTVDPDCRGCLREIDRERYHKIRREILTALGGACSCCGESEYSMLDIEHPNNDGKVHRTLLGRNVYKTILREIRSGLSSRFILRVMCSNCNQSRKRLGGKCAHEIDKQERA